ncbi:hypothetical protein HPB47_004716 [Ixodes persulcatus]|uniref:Uncharacterized protein n=1 Tax=Ixodes persulcatus TaxID=34615 RepID=A0AC60PF23_IXOPE|nr:hypothetical protein HPB47_004716 [Ixodes persulcatus]
MASYRVSWDPRAGRRWRWTTGVYFRTVVRGTGEFVFLRKSNFGPIKTIRTHSVRHARSTSRFARRLHSGSCPLWAEVNRRRSIGAWLEDWATTLKIFADIEWRTWAHRMEKWRQKSNAIHAKLSPSLFLSLAAGGLDLVNVVLKVHVQRFLLFRDRRYPLFLSALHHFGYPYLDRLVVSATGRTTGGAGLRFFAEIAASVEFVLGHFSWDYLLAGSRKTLMEPVPPCAAGLFKRVRRFPVPASTKDVFVRLHLEVLPVKVWLEGRFFLVPWYTNCGLCGASETIQHFFVECSNAHHFWDELRVAFGQDFEIELLNFKYLHLGGADDSDVAPAIVLLELQFIWLARTAVVERHTDARPTSDYFTSRPRWLLSIPAGEEYHEGGEWQHIKNRLEAKQLRDQRARQRRDRCGAN